ncbi:MAG: diphosphomevalonate decarboxylase [Flavobacteriales bacterium]|nr:diphosphomevalonate decarboxylase [Flavobacteriales bacterium]
MKTYHWQSPSNIALVKYWGKHGIQLPANPSISFTLDKCLTDTKLVLRPRQEDRVNFRFEGNERPDFIPKIQSFVDRIEPLIPFIQDYSLDIESRNTFPHSSGIASSASSMSALAMCLASASVDENGGEIDLQLASEMARLGSGSACRSVYGGYTLWGRTQHFSNSSDRYALPVLEIHKEFKDLQDTILLIDEGEKQVSSSVGHELMNSHPFADSRYVQAQSNIQKLLSVQDNGDFMELAEIIESEALTLHAMMLTSSPHFILFKPGSVSVIRRVMELRQMGQPMTFTLDAGANVHLIYPESFAQKALDIINEEFVGFCQNGAYICDSIGSGPKQLDL